MHANLRTTTRTALLALLTTLCAAPALAQDPEGDLLDQEAALLGGAELVEKEPKEEVVVVDPDEKLLEQVNAARRDLEKRLNELQPRALKFEKTAELVEPLLQEVLKTGDTFVSKQRKALVDYRAAAATDDAKGKKKAAATLAKLRAVFLKDLKRINKKADKVEKQYAKLAERAAKEDAEDAAEEDGDDDEE